MRIWRLDVCCYTMGLKILILGTPAIGDGILALSKDKTLDKPLQFADNLRRIRQQPQEVWIVKLADRVTN